MYAFLTRKYICICMHMCIHTAQLHGNKNVRGSRDPHWWIYMYIYIPQTSVCVYIYTAQLHGNNHVRGGQEPEWWLFATSDDLFSFYFIF